MKYTLLLEIGTEELPIKKLSKISELFTKKIINEFKKKNINYKKKKIFASPNRIGIKLIELNFLKSQKKYSYGPCKKYALDKNKKLNFIAHSWMKKNNIKKKQILFIKKKKKTFLSYIIKKEKINILIKNIIKKNLLKFNISRTMKWGGNNKKFIRPIKNIIILLNKKIIKTKIFDINSKKTIYGNMNNNIQKITINHAAEYTEKLLKLGKVINNYSIRKNKIKKDAIYLANKKNSKVKIKKNTLNEITALIEWPKVNLAKFKKKFLILPKEAIIYNIENIQKCFQVYNKSNKIKNYFIFVSNINPKKNKNIILGNEKVINARLEDAFFFYKSDKKKKLEDFFLKLKKIVFYKKNGNLLEKTRRIQLLIIKISKKNKINIKYALRAAYLSKCDLATKLVIEYPELQGIIGKNYAKRNKEKKKIYLAIKDHYKPTNKHDKTPSNLISSALAISDKFDTLTGLFIFKNKNKNKKKNDPFGLRRLTIGIIRIIIEKKIKINIKNFIKKSIKLYNLKNNYKIKNIYKKIKKFIKNRLLEYYTKLGYKKKILKLIFLKKNKNLISFDKKIKEIYDIKKKKIYISLLKTYKRIKNILKNNKIKKKIQKNLLKKKEEKEIYYLIKKNKTKINILYKKKKNKKIILKLKKFIQPINNFFENIIIKTKNVNKKKNRLILITKLEKIFSKADFLNYLNI